MNNLKINIEILQKLKKIHGKVESYENKSINDLVVKQNIQIQYTADLIEDEVLVNGEITGDLLLECSRCLESFKFPVKLSICQSYPLTDEDIDIEDEIRQQIILGIPLKPLCNVDCKGICPECGQNSNIVTCTCKTEKHDSRWEKLRSLLKKKN